MRLDYTIQELEDILADYFKTNRFMFTEDMSMLHAHAREITQQLVDAKRELQARADILNRAVRHKEALFPDEIGNGWIDSIDRMAHEISTLRGQLAAKERELEVARLAHKAADKDRQQALDMLDKAGVWTGADLLVHDRVASLIRDWQEQQRKIVTLQAEVGHLKNEITSR